MPSFVCKSLFSVCKFGNYVDENLAIPRAAKRVREKRNNKWKGRSSISHGSIGSFFCFPVRSRNDQIFVHVIPKFTSSRRVMGLQFLQTHLDLLPCVGSESASKEDMRVRKHSSTKAQQGIWEVRVMFEPSRLAHQWLQQAYEQVVPFAPQASLLQRSVQFKASSSVSCVNHFFL
jgi:hypothetical protein